MYRAALFVFGHLPDSVRSRIAHLLTPSFAVGSSPFVSREDGRLLLVRHSYKGGWGTPGGFLDRNEPAGLGAVREVFEETGLEVELVGEPAVVVDHEDRRVEYIIRARPVAGADADAVRPTSPEIVEVGWFDPNDLPQLQDHAAEALVGLLRAELSRGPDRLVTPDEP